MRTSIASFSFHQHIGDGRMSIYGYLESCRYRYGLDAADIWNGLLGSDPDTYLKPESLRRVRIAMDERGLSCANYHADGCHPWEDDAAWRVKAHDIALRHIEAASILGAKTFRIDTGGRGATWSDEEFDHIAARYREYTRLGEHGGFRVGPENHWGAGSGAHNLLKLAEAVNSPAFGVLLHLGRYPDATGPEGDRLLAPLAMHTHVDPGVLANRADEVLDILDGVSYKGYYGIENGHGGNEYEEVALMIAQLNQVLARRRAVQPPADPNHLIPEGAQD
jgi:xylose isomerase-like TIM barrel protein